MPTVDAAARVLIARWYDNPVLFARDVYGFVADTWQIDFMMAIARDKRVLARSGTGPGKSAALVMVILWWLVTRRPCKVLLTSGKREQILDVFWPEIEVWETKKRPEFGFIQFKKTEGRIVLVGAETTNMVLPRTAQAGRPETIQGQHSLNILVVADEIYAIPKIICQTLEGALSTPGSKMVGAGNPTRINCFAAECFKPGSEWTTFTVNGWDAKHVDKEWCAYMLRRYGEQHSQYRVRVLGLPPLEEANQVISRKAVDACLENSTAPFPHYREHWGLDIAGSGIRGDRTALAFRRANIQPRPVQSWLGMEAPDIVDAVVDLWNKANPKPAIIGIDANGMGGPVVDYLRRTPIKGQTMILPIKDQETAINKKDFASRGSELLYEMARWCNANTSSLCDNDLAEELTWYKADENAAGGRWKQVSKKPSTLFDAESVDIDDEAPASPDLGDAFKYTFARRDIAEVQRRRVQQHEQGSGSWMAI